MTRESMLLAGVLLVTIPTVMFGGLALLAQLAGGAPGYADNPLRHDLWRAGHAHAVASPTATAPNDLIWLACPGAASLAAGVLTTGIGLIRAARGATT